MSVDAVLSECLQRECNVSKETIANQLSKLSNPELQQWMREHDCRQCLDHDKRRKKENVEYIARRFAQGSGRLMSDPSTFRAVTDFIILSPDLFFPDNYE